MVLVVQDAMKAGVQKYCTVRPWESSWSKTGVGKNRLRSLRGCNECGSSADTKKIWFPPFNWPAPIAVLRYKLSLSQAAVAAAGICATTAITAKMVYYET